MDHTPTTPGDDRPIKILDRTPVDEDHKERLFALVRAAQTAAAEDGKELQSEFGKEAVSLIVGCNQFVRLFRAGETPGKVELWADAALQATLADAGFELSPPEGMIFQMFGWKALQPMAGELSILEEAVQACYRRARDHKTQSP